MLTFATSKHHWNYFLAIEKDLESLSRFIEFDEANMETYSIELAHILLSASSEVDVVMKLLCNLLAPAERAENIIHYIAIIQNHCPDLIMEEIVIHRHGITHKPWENLASSQSPDWWRSYNNVKHQRNAHYNEANLKNVINAVGALLITTVYYYRQLVLATDTIPSFQDITTSLSPGSSFLKLCNLDYYHQFLVV